MPLLMVFPLSEMHCPAFFFIPLRVPNEPFSDPLQEESVFIYALTTLSRIFYNT